MDDPTSDVVQENKNIIDPILRGIATGLVVGYFISKSVHGQDAGGSMHGIAVLVGCGFMFTVKSHKALAWVLLCITLLVGYYAIPAALTFGNNVFGSGVTYTMRNARIEKDKVLVDVVVKNGRDKTITYLEAACTAPKQPANILKFKDIKRNSAVVKHNQFVRTFDGTDDRTVDYSCSTIKIDY